MENSNKPTITRRSHMTPDKEYVQWLHDIKKRFKSSQINASVKVNNKLLAFYWSLGQDMVIHIDCNSYFASCEIAADRALEGKPVVVANDNEAGGGIVLALNDEAKALGLRRGQPLFQVRALIRENGVQVCHADHGKYHTISASIMKAVQRQGLVVDFVQYSVI